MFELTATEALIWAIGVSVIIVYIGSLAVLNNFDQYLDEEDEGND